MTETPSYTVRDFMSRQHVVIGKHTHMEDAEGLFRRHDFNLLPVLDNLRLVGVLTKMDLLKAFGTEAAPTFPAKLRSQEVERFMTHEPAALSPDTPIRRVVEEMIATRHRAFPVVEGDRLVGIISREDVLRALRQAADAQTPTA